MYEPNGATMYQHEPCMTFYDQSWAVYEPMYEQRKTNYEKLCKSMNTFMSPFMNKGKQTMNYEKLCKSMNTFIVTNIY